MGSAMSPGAQDVTAEMRPNGEDKREGGTGMRVSARPVVPRFIP